MQQAHLQDTANKSMKEIFESVPNAAFHHHFMTTWNSGAGSRDYEYYCRHSRQSLGMNNFFKTKNFILRDVENGLKTAIDYLVKEGYQILFASEQVAWVMHVVDNIPMFYGEIGVRDKVLQATFEGQEDWVNRMMNQVSDIFPDDGIETTTLMGFGQNGPKEKTEYLYPSEIDLAQTHYYPWLEEMGMTLNDFIHEFSEAKDPILLLIGPPGTGKSTLLRTMILEMDRKKNFLSSDSKVLLNDEFNSWLMDRPDRSLVAIEDADTLIESRERGNNSMSGILNATQGVVPNKTKVVISTNLSSIKSVDPALLRVGRTHRVVEFGLLTSAQACRIREIDGLPAVDFGDRDDISLAEALQSRGKEESNRKVKGIGFY